MMHVCIHNIYVYIHSDVCNIEISGKIIILYSKYKYASKIYYIVRNTFKKYVDR